MDGGLRCIRGLARAEVVRRGQCNRCGDCCRRLFRVQLPNTTEARQWLAARGVEIESADAERVHIAVDQTCPHLEMCGAVATCALHAAGVKPTLCECGPEQPADLMPGCGYWFEPEVATN